ncbi:4-hydroxy-2-oxoheptanedioate aldolase [Paraburkholderia sacchari]
MAGSSPGGLAHLSHPRGFPRDAAHFGVDRNRLGTRGRHAHERGASRAVASNRYPPQGIRGVSVGHRGNRFGTIADYFALANDNVCVIAQIESRKAVESIDGTLAVDGIDAVFIGPSDLAASHGHLGNANHPEVQQAIAHVFERAQAAGKASGPLATVQAEAEHYLSMGARVVAVCADLGLLKGAARAVQKHFMQKRAGEA